MGQVDSSSWTHAMANTDSNMPMDHDALGAMPWASAMMLVACMLMVAAVLAWLKFGLGLWTTTLLDTPMRAGDARVLSVTVAGHSLAVPGNMIPRAPAPANGELDIAFTWPALEGRGTHNAALFDDMSAHSRVIHVTVKKAQQTVSPARRFQQILAPSFRQAVPRPPQGLTGRMLAAGSGYGGETLYFTAADETGAPGFMIRCSQSTSARAPADCLRGVQLENGLYLEYRYRRPLLREWQAIDRRVTDLIGRFSHPNGS